MRRKNLGVTASICAAAMLLAGLAVAPSAMAAGATITLNGADGNSLAGHTFNVYQIGTYTDQILNGTQISSLGVRGTAASNAWAADAISIANAYDPGTYDDIAKVYGYDDAGNIANIKMDSQTRQLRNISKALSQSPRKPAAIQGGANLTTTQSTLTINVPAEGLYYITDSAGNPIMIGTKSGNANIMKNDAKDPQWRTLGTAVVKSKSMRVDKKVQVQRNGATVGKDRHQHGRGDRAEQAGRLRRQVQAHRPAEGPDVREGLAERPPEERAADRHHGRRGHLRRDHAEQREKHPRRPGFEDRGQQARRPGSRHPAGRLGHRRQEPSRQILQQDDRHHLQNDRRQGEHHRPGEQHRPHVRHVHRRRPVHHHHRPGQGRHQGVRLHLAEGGRGQREHAARRRPVPDPA